MSDPYSVEDDDEFDPAGLPGASWAQARALSVSEENPDDVARSYKITKGTGVNPALAQVDLDGFTRRRRQQVTSQIVEGNPWIRDYLIQNGTLAAVSNDDLDKLDSASQKMLEHSFWNSSPDTRVISAFGRGFAEDFVPGQIVLGKITPKDWEDHPYLTSLYINIGGPLTGLFDIPFTLFNAAVGGTAKGAKQLALEWGFSEENADQLDIAVRSVAEYGGAHGMAGGFHVAQPPGLRTRAFDAQKSAKIREILKSDLMGKPKVMAEVEDIVKTSAETRQPLRITVHPILDRIALEQAKVDAKLGDESLKEAEASATRERIPEAYRNFAGTGPEMEIRIPAEAIRRLYGEKEPAPEDGKLGWIPDIQRQLREAEGTGGNVKVSRAEFMANTSSEVYDQLHDDIIWRQHGGSIKETEALVEDWKKREEEDKALQVRPEPEPTKPASEAPKPKPALPGMERPVFEELEEKPPAEAKPEARPKEPTLDEVAQRKEEFVESKKGLSRGHLLTDDEVKAEARLQAAERGIPVEQAYADVMNDLFRRYGHEGEMTTELAKRFLLRSSALEIARRTSGTEPDIMAARARPKSLKLERMTEDRPSFVQEKEDAGIRQFEIINEKGHSVGVANIQELEGGKTLYFDWIGAHLKVLDKSRPGLVFGPKQMMMLLDDILKKFPNAERAGGWRVTGARMKSSSTGPYFFDLKRFRQELASLGYDAPNFKNFREMLSGREGRWGSIGDGVNVFIPKEWTPEERAAANAAFKILDRILPEKITRGAVLGIELPKADALGIFRQSTEDRAAIVVFAIGGEGLYTNSKGVALYPLANVVRHEGFHGLIREGYIDQAQYNILKKAALDGDWLKKHDIESRYGKASYETKVHEAIVHEYGEWGAGRSEGLPKNVQEIFQRIKDLIEEIRRVWREVTGKDPTALDLFKRIEEGDFKFKEPGPKADLSVEPVMAARPRGTKSKLKKGIGERMFEPKALNLNERYMRLYERLMDQTDRQDAEFQVRELEKDIRRALSKDWKIFAELHEPEARADVEARPDVAAANFFRRGIINGQETGRRYTLGEEFLTPEQIAKLPPALVSKSGIHPDVVVRGLGFRSTEDMIDRMARFEKARGEAGTKEYVERLVKDEVDKRTAKEMGGNLKDLIWNEVQDHVTSDGDLARIHEETMAAFEKARAAGVIPTSEPTRTRKEMKAVAEEEFNQRKVGQVDPNDDLRNSAKAARINERAQLDEDLKTAFKATQQRERALNLHAESKKFEKIQAQFNRTKKQVGRNRSLDNMEQESFNFAKYILGLLGELSEEAIRDNANEIAKLAEQKGTRRTLQEFVEHKRMLGVLIPEADFLFDPNWRSSREANINSVEDMRVAEFKAMNAMLQAITKNGREEKKLWRENRQIELKEAIDEMIAQQAELPGGKAERKDIPPGVLKEKLTRYWAASLNLEAIFNRFDKNNPLGPHNQILVYQFARAAVEEAALEKKFAERLRKDLTPIRNPNARVENPFFNTPRADGTFGEAMKLSRMNVLAIMQNVGNKSNFLKLLKGYGISEDLHPHVMKWLFENTTKEDWDRAQALGNIYRDAKTLVNRMYRDEVGVAPKSVETWKINTPWGEYEGWYHPVVYDRNLPQTSPKLKGRSDPMDSMFYDRTTPDSGYTKERTGYAGPISLNFDNVTNRLWDAIHDVSWRPTLNQLRKVFHDERFKESMREHYGQHYVDLLDPFLEHIAGSTQYVSDAMRSWQGFENFIVGNTVSMLVGLNPSTFVKHTATVWAHSAKEVGLRNYLRAIGAVLTENTASGVSVYQYAKNHSLELQFRDRNFMDLIRGGVDPTFGHLLIGKDLDSWLSNFTDRPLNEGVRLSLGMANGSYLSVRQGMIFVGSRPLAWADNFAATITWVAQYYKEMEKNGDHAQAVDLAERAIRRTHGSAAVTNKPQITYSNAPMVRSFTAFYNFFSHWFQRDFEIAWSTRGAIRGDKYYTGSNEYKMGRKMIPVIAGGLATYIGWSIMVEESVSPMHGTQDDPTWWYLTKLGFFGLTGTMVGLRELHGLIEGRDVTSAGLIGTIMQRATAPIRDLQRTGKSRLKDWEQSQRFLRDMNGMVGILTGLTYQGPLRAGTFAGNVIAGREHISEGFYPALVDIKRGVMTGTAKQPKGH